MTLQVSDMADRRPWVGSMRFAAVVLVTLVVAACGGRPEFGALAINDLPAEGADSRDILVVTTRDRDNRPDTFFNGERSDTINYAQATISIPPNHEPGAIEWPNQAPGNPKTDFVTRSAGYIDNADAFTRRINQRLAKLPRGDREIFVFIHGYNTRFPEGLYRFAQMVHDGDFNAVPVLFTWASRGHVQDYVYDLNSASVARDALAETLVRLSKTNAEKITILAHSMGNWLLMETARAATPEARRTLARKVQTVVLAAPDIDIDVFKAQLKRIGKPKNPYFVLVSRDDRALRLSRAIAGGKERVGAYSDDEELAELGAIVVDLTELESLDGARHSKFAQLAELSPELRESIRRSGLTSVTGMNGAANVGTGLGDVIGDTVTLPIRIVTAPFGG
ncbi:MAG: alpha/beta fold hydrolase [Roseibium sp.]|uniref:alpha/beta hydrolase n=1 Tax=Roseibium sp. TaxID=1936156 RepID=UPI001B24B859|nr:alpha/beta hydrolase [Roseibium sp.]MBO6891284.1 alpha/beta fold hydrolase [Roseibium sp.]MBO6931497.1 alpha/beta fold hydrolase [Roseibium sp.]